MASSSQQPQLVPHSGPEWQQLQDALQRRIALSEATWMARADEESQGVEYMVKFRIPTYILSGWRTSCLTWGGLAYGAAAWQLEEQLAMCRAAAESESYAYQLDGSEARFQYHEQQFMAEADADVGAWDADVGGWHTAADAAAGQQAAAAAVEAAAAAAAAVAAARNKPAKFVPAPGDWAGQRLRTLKDKHNEREVRRRARRAAEAAQAVAQAAAQGAASSAAPPSPRSPSEEPPPAKPRVVPPPRRP